MSHIKKIVGNWSIAVIPFLFLLSIGLISSKTLTYHQKVFKTLMLFVFDTALLAVFIISIFGEENIPKKARKHFLYFIAYFLFILFQFIISYFSKETSYDRGYYLANYSFLILFAMFFFLYLKNLDEIKTGLLMLNIFVVIVLLMSLYELVQIDFNLRSFRPKLSFGNTNYFAGYLIGMLPLVFITSILWWDKKLSIQNNWLSILSITIGVLGLVPLFFTQTRAAWLGAYVGIMFVLVPSLIMITKKIPTTIKIILVAVILTVFIVTPVLILKFPPPIVEKLLSRMVSTIANPVFYIEDRLNGWAGAWGLFKDHPIFGAGLGTTYPASFKYIGKYFFLYSSSNSFKHSHNEYVQVLGEAGIVGMIAFISLFGFIIVNMMKRVFSKLYKMDYRLICLGTGVGLVSMLIQQVFSLTLRMSVTMTAYFFLLGLGMFLFSFSKKALLKPETARKPLIRLPEWLNGSLTKVQFYIMLGSVGLLILISLILFLPVFRSEYNLVRALPMGRLSPLQTNHYLKRGIEKKPDNPYVWTQKYQYDFYYNLTRSGPNNGINEKYFPIVEKDLDSLQAIIPDYQDVWSKYAQLNLVKYEHYKMKWRQTRSIQDMNTSRESLKKALNYINKSLNNHFINEFSHENKLLILRELDNPQGYQQALKEYLEMLVYLRYCKTRRVLKSEIQIQFSMDSNSTVALVEDITVFTFANDEILNLYNELYEVYTMNSSKAFKAALVNKTLTIIAPRWQDRNRLIKESKAGGGA